MSRASRLPVIAFLLTFAAFGQQWETDKSKSAGATTRFIDNVFQYLNMADRTNRSPAFEPLTQKERNRLFTKSLINPIWFAKAGISAAQNQWKDEPEPWEQGAAGYGKRFGDSMGQYASRKVVTFGIESALHEDNRYFQSGKKGFWRRSGYALSSGILARHDNGKLYPSVSGLVGYASGAYLSRFWQPEGYRSVGDAAVSFGVSMAWNMGFGVVKEFLPDMVRPITRRLQQRSEVPAVKSHQKD